jgi:hypothetical protein
MCQTQKEALFNLIVVTLTLVAVLALYPILGRAASCGFALLALLGFGPIFYRKRRGQVVADERDNLIRRRSTIIAYTVFWLAFFATATLTAAFYGFDGAVPVPVIMNGVWFGAMLFVAAHAIATLAQYGRSDCDARV